MQKDNNQSEQIEDITIDKGYQDYDDGSKYEGEFQDNLKHGKGKLTKGLDYSYEGDWIADKKEGQGIEISNGNRYEGYFKQDKKYGIGRIEYNDKSIYEGNFRENLPNGKGKLMGIDQIIYEGTFVDGQIIYGQISYKNGQKYNGQIKQNQQNGKGRLIDAEGQKIFEGNFKNDKALYKYNYNTPDQKLALLATTKDVIQLEIIIDQLEGHDVQLLSMFENLEILTIEFKDKKNVKLNAELAKQFLDNCNNYQKITELNLLIPRADVFLEKTEIVEAGTFATIFQSIAKFQNLKKLELGLANWGAENEKIDQSIIQELIQTYQIFTQLIHLSIDIHGWGYRNKTLNQQDVVNIVQSIDLFQGQLITFELDMGRWCCEDYGNFKYISDLELSQIGQIISQQSGLEKLNLNLRSWGYSNPKITDLGLGELFDGISMCSTLRSLELNLRGFGYQNVNITQESIQKLIKCLPNFSNLEKFYINVEIWWNEGCNKGSQIWTDLLNGLSNLPLCIDKKIKHDNNDE